MTLTPYTKNLLGRLRDLMAVSDDEVVQRGIAQATTDRIIKLRQRAAQLAARYGAIEKLDAQIKKQGVSPDDHILYTDLLEWRAVRHELEQLTSFLEAV